MSAWCGISCDWYSQEWNDGNDKETIVGYNVGDNDDNDNDGNDDEDGV